MKLKVSDKKILIFIVAFVLYSLACSAQDGTELSKTETINVYRSLIRSSQDPKEVADAHYKIGYILETLGRNTEATAEYLKVIINYPELGEISKKAEKRLSNLYAGFSAKSQELAAGHEVVESQKDPSIFFAYIKSLYENHRDLGQYDKAINVLKNLYDIDQENPIYLIEIGEIYLDGYNNPDKAILHFKKVIEINPENPKAYMELGRSYEKKGDYENASRLYAKTVEISPASPAAMCALRRSEGIRLAEEKQLVKDWYFIGPFDNSDREGLGKVFPPEEKIDLEATCDGKDRASIKWFRAFDYNESGYVDLNNLFKPNDYAVAYLATYVNSPSKRDVVFRFGSEDGIKIWLNDKEIADRSIARSGDVDGDSVQATLEKGWNKILLKVSDTWGSWGVYFRITDLRGNPEEDLVFDPLKDDERLKVIYGQIVRAKRFQFTKIATVYTGALSIFLLGIYFMISNILAKVKINRMKQDFISSVSHELKTPIAAVKMLAETLRRGKIKDAKRKDQYYNMIIRESDRLTRFINKILDFAKIEKGGKVFYFEEANISELAKTAVDIYKEEAQDESLVLNLNLSKEDIEAEVDQDAILQVILNLMDNAYKYSKDEKNITVNVRENANVVIVEVADKGLGIPKESLEKIFDKFYRAGQYMMDGIKGSGLGLSFVKSVINAHSGKIAVESEVNKGTKFVISLPKKSVQKGG